MDDGFPPSRRDEIYLAGRPDTLCLANFQLSRWDERRCQMQFGMDDWGNSRLNSINTIVQMKIAWPIYFTAAVVAIVSFSIAYYLSEHELLATVVASPGSAALFGALFQIFRDYAAFQRARALQNENNNFILSATSHMANVAFDKHTAFAEEYLYAVEEELSKLFSIGPSGAIEKPAHEAWNRLFAVRKKFGAWVTKEIREVLAPFEQKLLNLHALAGLLNSSSEGYQRQKTVQELAEAYKIIADIKEPGAKADAIQPKEKLQTLLGIPNFTKLREIYVSRALEQQSDSRLLIPPV
jgi:hypothetical protein